MDFSPRLAWFGKVLLKDGFDLGQFGGRQPRIADRRWSFWVIQLENGPPLRSDDVNVCGAMIIGVDRHAIGVEAQDGRHGGQFNKNPNCWVFFEAPKSRRLFTETVDNCRQIEIILF
jgi:hypothetical protein